jgi:hypothetical protein
MARSSLWILATIAKINSVYNIFHIYILYYEIYTEPVKDRRSQLGTSGTKREEGDRQAATKLGLRPNEVAIRRTSYGCLS